MAISPQDLENKPWSTADQLRGNSELHSAEYKTPVLDLVSLRFPMSDSVLLRRS